MAKLGIIAGGGNLPRDIADYCIKIGRPVFVLGLRTFADPDSFRDVDFAEAGLAQASKALELLKNAGVSEIVFAGKVERPSLKSLKPDLKAASILARLGKGFLGDNSLMGAVKAAFEEEGFRIVGVDEVFDDVLAVAGTWGQVSPASSKMNDIRTGLKLAKGIGALDIGQSVVVQDGLCIAVEAIEGTDAMIRRCRAIVEDDAQPILIKVKKPQQDRRLDLPTVGPNTVRAAAEAGFAGIVVEAGHTLVVSKNEMLEIADEAGLFLFGAELEDSK
jgi:UDP-2,3-diacylglucosamine hydrolase